MRTRNWILLIMLIASTGMLAVVLVTSIVQAQNPPTTPRYSPSVPTQGLEDLMALRAQVAAQNDVIIILVDQVQNGIRDDMEYLRSVEYTSTFTKTAYTTGTPGIPSRGYEPIEDVLIRGQIAIDQWGAIKASLTP